jgi:hypothetical protein
MHYGSSFTPRSYVIFINPNFKFYACFNSGIVFDTKFLMKFLRISLAFGSLKHSVNNF